MKRANNYNNNYINNNNNNYINNNINYNSVNNLVQLKRKRIKIRFYKQTLKKLNKTNMLLLKFHSILKILKIADNYNNHKINTNIKNLVLIYLKRKRINFRFLKQTVKKLKKIKILKP